MTESDTQLIAALFSIELKLESLADDLSEEDRERLEEIVASIHDLRLDQQPTHFFGDQFR